MIEKLFDVPFIADLALREKQIQQNYRPIIAVHKWFARRPGTLFRGLLLSEFGEAPLRESFYRRNSLKGIKVADPFMGGGTPLLEANRLGCDVLGFDINPMSYWIVSREIEHLDLEEYSKTAEKLREQLEKEVGELYRTRCVICGSSNAHVKYFLWVKAISCLACGQNLDLFPGYLLATDSRHPKNVFICPGCGGLNETESRRDPGSCRHCGKELSMEGPAKRNKCLCRHCGAENRFPNLAAGPPKHRLFALEYQCPECKESHVGRFFKPPDQEDLDRFREAEKRWTNTKNQYVPDDEIPPGDETNRLHRWGYKFYRELFNTRQLLGLEISARLVSRIRNDRIRDALATNFSDLLRYQNMLCRYDTAALKSLDVFSVHGFPAGLIQCESNLLGIMGPGSNSCVGSGGWANIIEKFRKAKAYCENPFEVRHQGKRKEVVRIEGEWIGDHRGSKTREEKRSVELYCADAATAVIPPSSLDAVFTDPPYFGNVQYAELMDFCYVWLRRLTEDGREAFNLPSTRNARELTGNQELGRGLDHFAEGLSTVFQRMAQALKPGAPLAFTYHHNDISAYYPVAVAILDTGLACSASLPCPAEMGASIHINGTGSSIIDTVFVCRSTGSIPRKWMAGSIAEVADLVREDLDLLREGNVRPTAGDIRCITHGHLVRLAIWALRGSWDKNLIISRRLSNVAAWLKNFGDWRNIEALLAEDEEPLFDAPLFKKRKPMSELETEHAPISF